MISSCSLDPRLLLRVIDEFYLSAMRLHHGRILGVAPAASLRDCGISAMNAGREQQVLTLVRLLRGGNGKGKTREEPTREASSSSQDAGPARLHRLLHELGLPELT